MATPIKPNYSKTVLLFSGGMDSIMAWKLYKPDILLYIKCGSKYEKKEIAFCKRLIKKYKAPIIFDNSLSLGQWERSDAIIPLRNLLFISIASYYGDKIYIGAMNGDRTLDKSIEFLAKTQRLLGYLYQKQHWTDLRHIKIEALYGKRLTKTELVSEYLSTGYDKKLLIESLSCYDAKEGHCGNCKPCFRKWVAFRNNSLPTDFFKTNPINSKEGKRIVWQCKEAKENNLVYRSEKEDKETLRAYGYRL